MMKLYYSTASPFARKARVVARETGLDARIEEVVTTVSPVKANVELGRDNPVMKVPTLALDDGTALFDSPVICEYLDGLHSGRKLFPPAGKARWNALRLQAAGDGILDAGILCRYETVLRPEPLRWADWIAGQTEKWHAGLDFLERSAGDLEGEPTIGGITAGCVLGWLDFRFGDDDWRSGRPNLARWYERFAARPSMQATIPYA
jgi:glutathione S-transferase